jgi:ankyrin repeat protein
VSSIDNLKKEAKRRLKALRAQQPALSAMPTLRDVQHALAREHGHESWTAMIQSIERERQTGAEPPADLIAAFLEFACWDHHVHGKGDHRRADLAAQRLLAQHPKIAHDSIYTAIVCGEIDDVRRRIAANAHVARDAGGPRGWTPLLYLCFTRFTHRPTIDNAVAIGRLLLDAGANPNDFYMAASAPYSALVGAAGEGEQESPRQPWAAALFELLLQRGAKPFDQQVLYNTHFHGDVLWWLELVWKYTRNTELAAAWKDPEWRMLDMGNYGTGARFLEDLADKKQDRRLLEWIEAHGARSATEAKVPTNRRQRDPGPLDDLFTAAARDDVDAVARLLDAGVPIESEDNTKQRALHVAAAANAVNVAAMLLERGAEVDPVETRFSATPMGFASYYHHTAILALLSSRSSDLYDLCWEGYVDRIRVVLRKDPQRAKSLPSPLFWLPEDEDDALAVADMLLTAGADAGRRNVSGQTPADVAERRGLLRLAARLRQGESARPAPPSGELETLDALAHDLVLAYESGFEPAIQRLQEHFKRELTWDELRNAVRERLSAIPPEQLPNRTQTDVYFAVPQARLLIARASGFETWEALARYHQGT